MRSVLVVLYPDSMPIRVLLDTNALYDNKWRASEGMRTFARLCKSGHVQCIVPHVVEQEIISQAVTHQSSGLAALHASFKKLKKYNLPPADYAALSQALAALKVNEGVVLQSPAAEFQAWCEDIQAVRADLRAEHARNILNGYFSGTAPFKSVKSRKDFPDAFIYEVVKDYCGEALYVICDDAALRKACAKLKNVTALQNIDHFIALSNVKALIVAESSPVPVIERASLEEIEARKASKSENAVDYVLELLAKANVRSPVWDTKLISDVRQELMGESIHSPMFASNDRSGYVNVLLIDAVDYLAASATYYGDWKFSLQFKMRGTALVQYYHSWDSGLKIYGRDVSTKTVYKDVEEVSAILDLALSGRAIVELDIERVVSQGVVDSFRSIALDEILEFELSATAHDDEDDINPFMSLDGLA